MQVYLDRNIVVGASITATPDDELEIVLADQNEEVNLTCRRMVKEVGGNKTVEFTFNDIEEVGRLRDFITAALAKHKSTLEALASLLPS